MSVIVPVFNDAGGVACLLESLCKQTYIDFEVIVVDNGSDPQIAIQGTFPFQVHLLRCTTPGSYAARNHGASAAAGHMLAFTDADCIPHKNWVENGMNTILQSGDACVAGGEVEVMDPPKRTATGLYQKIVGFQQLQNIERKGFSVTANLFCVRTKFKQVGPFRTDLFSGGDLEWSQRATRAGCQLQYAPNAIVRTMPRTSLRSAIVQARRVTAGRHHMRLQSGNVITQRMLAPHRRPHDSAKWILRHPDLSPIERLKVLGVASVIKATSLLEVLRLKFGMAPERR